MHTHTHTSSLAWGCRPHACFARPPAAPQACRLRPTGRRPPRPAQDPSQAPPNQVCRLCGGCGAASSPLLLRQSAPDKPLCACCGTGLGQAAPRHNCRQDPLLRVHWPDAAAVAAPRRRFTNSLQHRSAGPTSGSCPSAVLLRPSPALDPQACTICRAVSSNFSGQAADWPFGLSAESAHNAPAVFSIIVNSQTKQIECPSIQSLE